jgi:hypothetical protein
MGRDRFWEWVGLMYRRLRRRRSGLAAVLNDNEVFETAGRMRYLLPSPKHHQILAQIAVSVAVLAELPGLVASLPKAEMGPLCVGFRVVDVNMVASQRQKVNAAPMEIRGGECQCQLQQPL